MYVNKQGAKRKSKYLSENIYSNKEQTPLTVKQQSICI